MAPYLYDQFFIKKHDERRELFMMLTQNFKPRSGIYPGSFVQITPAFYIPEMAFVDSDRRMNSFFGASDTFSYILSQKTYPGPSSIAWRQSDYSSMLDLPENHYDIMFSFFAGFISQACKRYLKPLGILVANNSHGDASLALADPEYEILGIALREGGRFRIKLEGFQEYCQKSDGSDIDTEKVRKRMMGEKLKKQAFAYIFRKR